MVSLLREEALKGISETFIEYSVCLIVGRRMSNQIGRYGRNEGSSKSIKFHERGRDVLRLLFNGD